MMMKIKVENFLYNGEGDKKQLIIPMTIEGSHTIDHTSVMVDMFNPSYFAERISNLYLGLLLLSAEVYAIDRGLPRNIESVNGWSREFEVEFSIPGASDFQNQAQSINSLLSFLTGDYWECSFKECQSIEWCHRDDVINLNGISQVNLFSGGMDSLIGAIDYMESHDNHQKLFLASHHDSKMGGPKNDQKKVVKEFKKMYNDRFIYFSPEGITPTVSKELTCRSRSLMFLAIAIMVAAYCSVNVIVPENGPVSLNFPLSVSRRAACSTRTTHPLFIQSVRDLLLSLDIPVEIENPYEFMTKGEMVENCKNIDYLLSIVNKSNSCGKRSQHQFMYDDIKATHCGRCMPCMYRKASMVDYSDSTSYGIKMETLFLQSQKISNDFYAMLNYLRRNLSRDSIAHELSIMGMKRSNLHFDDYVELVVRTREELKKLLIKEAPQEVKKYAGLI